MVSLLWFAPRDLIRFGAAASPSSEGFEFEGQSRGIRSTVRSGFRSSE